MHVALAPYTHAALPEGQYHRGSTPGGQGSTVGSGDISTRVRPRARILFRPRAAYEDRTSCEVGLDHSVTWPPEHGLAIELGLAIAKLMQRLTNNTNILNFARTRVL